MNRLTVLRYLNTGAPDLTLFNKKNNFKILIFLTKQMLIQN